MKHWDHVNAITAQWGEVLPSVMMDKKENRSSTTNNCKSAKR